MFFTIQKVTSTIIQENIKLHGLFCLIMRLVKITVEYCDTICDNILIAVVLNNCHRIILMQIQQEKLLINHLINHFGSDDRSPLLYSNYTTITSLQKS